jgi:phage terminase large subunit-like protein
LIERAQIVINGSTYENRDNLAEDFLRDISIYEGTALGRQEIHGELLDISESAVVKQSWLKLWPAKSPLPWFEFILVGMDTAFTERTFDKKALEADPTACQVWGVFAHNRRWNLLLLERWSDHVGFPELVRRAKKELKAVYGRRSEVLFKPMIGNSMHAEQEKRPDLLLVEEKGSGISLRQMLSTEGIDSWPYNPGKADKLSRLHSVSHVAANGRIWLPESTKTPGEPRNWILPLLDELCVYSGPGTVRHDDDVDVASMCWRYFADRWLNAGIEGVMKSDTATVNVNIEGVDQLEWIEGEDKLPGMLYTEELENPYG